MNKLVEDVVNELKINHPDRNITYTIDPLPNACGDHSLGNNITVRMLPEEANREGQMEEPKRIAREIHERIGQLLVASKF